MNDAIVDLARYHGYIYAKSLSVSLDNCGPMALGDLLYEINQKASHFP